MCMNCDLCPYQSDCDGCPHQKDDFIECDDNGVPFAWETCGREENEV